MLKVGLFLDAYVLCVFSLNLCGSIYRLSSSLSTSIGGSRIDLIRRDLKREIR